MNEFEIQKKVVQHIQLKYPDLCITVSPAAGFKVSRGVAMKIIAMGYQKGTPDIILLTPRLSYHGFAIELKTLTGQTSPEQDIYLEKLAREGYLTAVHRGVDAAVEQIDWYMGLPF